MNEQEKYDWMVYVFCPTFNHASYIEETMRGFTMQETTFPFVCIIVDDASTDDEQGIIKKYLVDNFELNDKDYARNEETVDYFLTFARHKTNHNCFFAVYFLKYNHYSIRKSKDPYITEWNSNSKYIAICEGDDYWFSKDKLQKQVDYLESNSGCGMVYTAFRLQNELTGVNKDIYTSDVIQNDDTFKWKLLEQKVIIGTCTVLIRADLYREAREIKDDYQGFLMDDTQTWFNTVRLSGIGYIPEITGVYRKQATGATAIFDSERRFRFLQNGLDMHLHLAYKYGAPEETVRVIKETYGLCFISCHIGIKEYDKAQIVNKKYFNENAAIKVYLMILKFMGITKPRGLGFVASRICINK